MPKVSIYKYRRSMWSIKGFFRNLDNIPKSIVVNMGLYQLYIEW